MGGRDDDLIKYRLGQANAALSDAKFLLDNNRTPQSIINRAYYSMFYAALALLQKTGDVPSKHGGTISIFDTQFVRKGIFPKEMSKDFHKAFELRQLSDYRTMESATMEAAEEAVDKAVGFVGHIEKYLKSG